MKVTSKSGFLSKKELCWKAISVANLKTKVGKKKSRKLLAIEIAYDITLKVWKRLSEMPRIKNLQMNNKHNNNKAMLVTKPPIFQFCKKKKLNEKTDTCQSSRVSHLHTKSFPSLEHMLNPNNIHKILRNSQITKCFLFVSCKWIFDLPSNRIQTQWNDIEYQNKSLFHKMKQKKKFQINFLLEC